jgi:hypothetical protein
MNTMRTMAVSAGILAMAGLGTACSSSGGGASPTASPAATRSAVAVTTAPASVQSIDDWLPASTSVLSDLTTDLHGITAEMTADPASVSGSANVTRLAADARTGLRLDAPAGYPGIDRAWDRVMNDYLRTAGDLTAGDYTRATTDLNSATTDTNVFQLELPSF